MLCRLWDDDRVTRVSTLAPGLQACGQDEGNDRLVEGGAGGAQA